MHRPGDGAAFGHRAPLAWPVRPGGPARAQRPSTLRPSRLVHPPQAAEVKAPACRLPAESEVPLSRWSCPELAREAARRGIAPFMSASTVRRWPAQDALKPWQHRSWIFITSPGFRLKAAWVLELYARTRQGEQFGDDEYVFWIVDNVSSHRGQKAAGRLTAAFPNTVMVHTPVHASWLNQVEIYFSAVQRKALSPNDFTDLTADQRPPTCLAAATSWRNRRQNSWFPAYSPRTILTATVRPPVVRPR